MSFNNPGFPGNSCELKPIPHEPSLLQDATETGKMLDSIMQPADLEGITTAITKLALHCGMQSKAPEQVKSMLADYYQDLSKYPQFLINDACASYRKQAEGNSFLPGSGLLIALMDKKYLKLKSMKSKIDQMSGLAKPEPESGNGMVSLQDVLNSMN